MTELLQPLSALAEGHSAANENSDSINSRNDVIAHRAEIGTKIDDIGDKQQQDNEPQQPYGLVPPKIVGDADPGHRADAGTDFLKDRHQREAEQHHSSEAVAELRSDLTVGGDPTRIVVCGTGDQSRSQAA